MYSSKLVAGAGQRFESARRLSIRLRREPLQEGRGGTVLGDFLWGVHHREEVDPRSMEPLPSGEPTTSQTVTYPREL